MKLPYNSKWMTVVLLSFAISGCAHPFPGGLRTIENPNSKLGSTVKICGKQIDSANIQLGKAGNVAAGLRGLSVVDHGPNDALHRGNICVEGELVFVGCETKEVMCTDAAYNYGIRIKRIIELR